MRRTSLLALGGLLLSATLGSLTAQPALPPGARESREAKEPKAEFALQPQHGPYLIYIASFRGEEAWDLAHNLAEELRRDYRLGAFILRRVDQDAETERRRLLELQAKRQEDEYVPPSRRIVRVQDEYAVMVGHFADLKTARAKIDELKKLDRPKSLGMSGLVMWKQRMDTPKPTDVKKLDEKPTNPFNHAFATINPLARQQRQQAGNNNPFEEMNWMELNKKEQYSLLSCPQPYTLIVKEFRSAEASKLRPKSDFDPKKWNRQPKLGTRDAFTFLPPAMDQADKALDFAKTLRGEGFQAYVLHLGETSFVTVGGFSGLRDPALAQNWVALKKRYGSEPMLQNTVPALMPVPGRDAPPLGEPLKK